MTSGCKFDISTFQRGLRAKLSVSTKANAEVLNQAAGSVCANAIRLTPKTSAAAIKAELQTNGLVFKLLQSPAMQGRLPRKLQGYTRGTHTRAQIAAAADQLIRARALSARAIAAGWFKALAVFRAGSARKVSDKGLAGQGRATRATVARLVATFENHSRGAAKIGAAPLQQALDQEGRALLAYWQKKMAAALR